MEDEEISNSKINIVGTSAVEDLMRTGLASDVVWGDVHTFGGVGGGLPGSIFSRLQRSKDRGI